MKENKISPFFNIIRTIWQNCKFLIYFNLTVAVVSIIILLLIEKEYKSTALISVEDKDQSFEMPAVLGVLSSGFGNILQSGGSNVERLIRLGESRRVMDAVIDKFNLDEHYDKEFRQDTYKTIKSNLHIENNDDGTISLSYIFNDPEMASQLTLEFYQQIKELDIELSMKQAGDYKNFIEQRYKEANGQLTEYEVQLKGFSERTGIVDIKEQAVQSIMFLSDLEAQKITAELERDLLESTVSKNNFNYKQIDEQVQNIQKKINVLLKQDIYSNVPVDSLPTQILQYTRLYRNVKIQETIIEYLLPHLEKAKMDEKKNISSLLLIDEPAPAQRKYSPKRAQILIIIMFISFIFSLVTVRFLEMYRINKPYIKELLTK